MAIEKGSIRQIGPGKSGDLGIADGERPLFIFKGPLFDPNIHQVRNKEIVPGWNPGDFPGLDSFGWGVHPNGVIDCVNMPMCTHGFGVKGAINWENLWRLEASEMEIFMVNRRLTEGYKRFLDRIIVQVRLDMTTVQMIPDPETWVVAVPRKGSEKSIPANTTGRLTLWAGPTPKAEQQRINGFSLRDISIEFMGTGRDKGWPRSRSPAKS